MTQFQFILYVKDQQKSTEFYQNLLLKLPVLNVPGMTEFQLSLEVKLGIMPEKGIQKILKNIVPNPEDGNGIPRCEIYIYVDSPTNYLNRALSHGAIKIDIEQNREWGDSVAYCSDLDGHILAFARKI
jgi:catechol 2,3-dioxygenase-like lactoylglutathione lyase family enzyme